MTAHHECIESRRILLSVSLSRVLVFVCPNIATQWVQCSLGNLKPHEPL